MELPIDDDIVKKLEELEKLLNQPTFDRYPMFEWTPGITIMGNMTESEYKSWNEENAEFQLIEDIVEEII